MIPPLQPDLDIVVCKSCGGDWDRWHQHNEGRESWWAHLIRRWKR